MAVGLVIIDDLPMDNGILKFRRELLGAGCSNGGQHEETKKHGTQTFAASLFHECNPF